jgi:GTPase Era involved in 16S rRNA processing
MTPTRRTAEQGAIVQLLQQQQQDQTQQIFPDTPNLGYPKQPAQPTTDTAATATAVEDDQVITMTNEEHECGSERDDDHAFDHSADPKGTVKVVRSIKACDVSPTPPS